MTGEPTPTQVEDARLVERSREGDQEAFSLLVRRHLRAAHRVALRKTGSRHDAEDVCQDAFVSALLRIEDCRRPERFRAWLLAIVRNTAVNAMERKRVRRTEKLDGLADAAGGGGPEGDFERAALRDELRRAVAELPEMQRRVLLMHDYEGWTHAEIGRELEIAAGTSRFHLHAARTAMRGLLGAERDADGGSGPLAGEKG